MTALPEAAPAVDTEALRRGDWIQTFTGRRFWPLDARAEDVAIEDIAHALANQCRYAGHCLRFYSVAEHCVLLSRHVAPAQALAALLHDAAEAYLVDLPRPVKPYLAGYKDAERALERVIAQAFGLPSDWITPEVHAVDNAILADERAQNMHPTGDDWRLPPPLGVTLAFWSPDEAEIAFLQRFRELTLLAEIDRLRAALAAATTRAEGMAPAPCLATDAMLDRGAAVLKDYPPGGFHG